MQTPLLSIAFFLIASLLGARGQYLYKSGADEVGGSALDYLTSPRILGGVVCYVAVMVLFVAAFRKGGALTVLYPIYAPTFVWAAVIVWWAYGTAIRPVHVAGMLVARTDVPVVPCGLQGAFAAWRPEQRLPRCKKVRLRIGPPLRFTGTENQRRGWQQVAVETEAAAKSLLSEG